MALNAADLDRLRRCIELAGEALDAGDEPFGSILVAADGRTLAEDRNRVSGGDATQHPEFALARWAAENMTAEERATATVYTSGEHCAMCSAAHGWVGLGRIVYAASAAQFSNWMEEFGVPPARVRPLAICDVIPDAAVDGPAPELVEEVRRLHERHRRRGPN